MNQIRLLPEPVRLIHFGVFEVDLKAGELRKNGLKIKLQEQPFLILSLLLEQAGEVVTREELRQKLWSTDTFVDVDHRLNVAVKKLRNALGDSADNPRFVETLARRGYRFIAPVNQPFKDLEDKVTELANLNDSGGNGVARGAERRFRWLVVPSMVLAAVIGALGLYWLAPDEKETLRHINSLAILPFTNASGDPNSVYLSDGITESLINRFSRLRQLHVVARTTVFRYKGKELNVQDVGRQLNVAAVLTGRVLQEGQSINIQVELVDVADGSQAWGEQYHRKLTDFVGVLEEISREISEKLGLRLTGEEQKELTKRYTQSDEAYHFYLKGLYFWNRRTEPELQKAIDHFQRAIDKDPNYALAYAMMADCYGILGTSENSPPSEMFPKAKAAASKALKIDDTLAEGHVRLAGAELGEWNWRGAEREYQRAIKLNPGFATAHQRYSLLLMAMGRTQESLAEIRRALELDPVSLTINTSFGWRLYFARRYNEAIEQFEETLEMDPNFASAHFHLGKTYARKGHYKEALAAFGQAHAFSKVAATAMEGYTSAVSGQRGKARKILSELEQQSKIRYVSPYDIAIIYTGLGEKDQALAWLQKACDERVFRVVFLRVEPLLDELRSDPRFQALVKRIGLSRELAQ
jgi:TolB-like protein/DNA-binding winged helix-turn-helix (wHTH) protein/Flp pilus assembly protein TadD